MAEVIGTVSAVAGLVGQAFTLFQAITEARRKVKGASKTLDDVMRQIDTTDQSLRLVRDERTIQTPFVALQLQEIIRVAEELQDFFQHLIAEQQRRTIDKLFHQLKSGDAEDKMLGSILDRLDRARSELALRISVAQVGLVGDLDSGLRVVFDVLLETNRKVEQVLGVSLDLAQRVGTKAPDENGTVALEKDDLRNVAAPDPQSASDEYRLFYDNIAAGDVRIMTGNVGVSEGHIRAERNEAVFGNKFGGSVQVMTGDMGGKAAESFNESFWN